MVLFEKCGEINTKEALAIAFDEAKKRGIKHVVIASTRGETAKSALPYLTNSKIQTIIVTHNTGFNEPDKQQFDASVRKDLEHAGAIVYTGTMVLRGLGRALRNKMQYSQEEIVANTLRIFCQGVKVACEMAGMVCDAGLVASKENIITVSGTSWGADTVCLITPNSSNNFFDIKVKEILAKPVNF